MASGVVAGPANAQSVTGHLAMVASVSRGHAARAARGASLLGSYDAAASDSQGTPVPVAMAAAAPAIAAAPVIAAGLARPTDVPWPGRRGWPTRGQKGSRADGRASGAPAASAPSASSSGSQAGAAHPSPSASATASPAPSPSAPPEQPLTFYDSTTPAAIPAGNVIATYVTGHFAVPASAVAGRPVIWIDTWATDPDASVLDVEPGDATPAMAATWVAEKLAKDPSARARLYTMLSEWPAVRAAIATLPSWMQSRVSWWIADPTGVPHMVPGANATQWYWGSSYDISTADPGF